MEKYDKIIIGAGLYGLYSALFCCKKGQKVVVLECDPTPFRRATFINQASQRMVSCLSKRHNREAKRSWIASSMMRTRLTSSQRTQRITDPCVKYMA